MKAREITSPTNPLLKVFRHGLGAGVTRDGWLAVEGPHLVEEALHTARVQSVLVGRKAADKFRNLLEQLPKEAELAQVPDRLFERLAQTENPQGIAALVELPRYDWETIVAQQDVLLLVACGIQDPGNLGTMVRSAQALGATAVMTLEETVSPFNPKAVRASAGAIFRVPLLHDLEAEALFPRVRTAGVHVIAADQKSRVPLCQADLRSSVAILIGREGSGLAPEISREANEHLAIPIRPGPDSLNAAVAASIFLYEAARQRGFRY